MSAALHHRTPTLQVLESRGLPVRHIGYHRASADDRAQARITRRTHDAAGRVSAQWDPRLLARLEAGEPVTTNMTTLYSLSGLPIVSDSVDAGRKLCLFADTGLPANQWDSRQTHWQTEYDELLRPVIIKETAAGTSERVAERYEYGAASSDAATRNQCGRLIRHDDAAGSRSIAEYSLAGKTLSETRRFLTSLDEPDWPESQTARDVLLEIGDGETSHWNHGPLGDVFDQTDARGHRQRFMYSVAGEVVQASLQLAGGDEQLVIEDIGYNAFGAIERQTAGNGAVSSAEYDPADGRLRRLHTDRPGKTAVQDLLYEYDPVGNIVRTEDKSQQTRHFANQRIDPVNTYGYDTLYQLIQATGREALGATLQPGLPALSPTPGDTSQLLNYTQHYQYDKGGNLFELRHVGHQSYTRSLAVAADSNRALPLDDNGAPPDFSAGFDANGNRLALSAGQTMRWDARNQLRSVDQVTRREGLNDAERYAYGSDHMRVRKVRSSVAGSVTHLAEVRYLPSLELRTDTARQEQLEVITVKAGLWSVRCLHWVDGQPEGIVADPFRYSLDDQLGSSTVELDADANLISHEGYYPYGGTAWWAARSAVEAGYKTVRYSGKERDATGLYYYGFRYYVPWLGRWLNPDPAGTVDGLNLYGMVVNNPITLKDETGLMFARVAGKAVVGGSMLGYELHKNRKKPTQQEPSTQPPSGSFGDNKLRAAGEKLDANVEKFDVLEKARDVINGRGKSLDKLANGEAAAPNAVVEGAKNLHKLTEFTMTGDIADIDMTQVSKAVVKDTMYNFGDGVKALYHGAQGAAALATASEEELHRLQESVNNLVEKTVDEAVVSGSVGLSGKAMLDAAALLAPHPLLKIGFKFASGVWTLGGIVYTTEQIAEFQQSLERNTSHETKKTILEQVTQANIKNRTVYDVTYQQP